MGFRDFDTSKLLEVALDGKTLCHIDGRGEAPYPVIAAYEDLSEMNSHPSTSQYTIGANDEAAFSAYVRDFRHSFPSTFEFISPSDYVANSEEQEPLVICSKAATCKYECGAKEEHRHEDCEECPFRTDAECLNVE